MSGSEYAPPSGSVFRHRKTGKTKIVRYGTGCGVHWTGEYGEWRYECWERWNSWIKNAEDITPNAVDQVSSGAR